MERSLYTVCTLISKASFSLNKMGVDFLVYRAILAYFAYVTLELLVGKNHENHTVLQEKQKSFLLIVYPGQFAISEPPEEDWNQVRNFPTSLTADI